jgi:hypothetical protein
VTARLRRGVSDAVARGRALAARAEAHARATRWLGHAIELAQRRPEAVLGAALITGVAVMVLHWR